MFDGYKDRQPLSPNDRQPSLNASRFEVFNKTPYQLSNFKKPVNCHIGKMSPRASPFARRDEDTSAFYNTSKDFVMNRTDTYTPSIKKMKPHDHPSSVITVSPDATINYKNALNTKTTHIKPKILALTNFQKQ
jgi:hypothetical protein